MILLKETHLTSHSTVISEIYLSEKFLEEFYISIFFVAFRFGTIFDFLQVVNDHVIFVR